MNRHERGDTLIEVILALAILTFVIMSAFALTSRSFRASIQARERTQAAQIMQQQAEALRGLRDNADNWEAFQDYFQGYGGTVSPSSFHIVRSGTTWEPVSGTVNSSALDVGSDLYTVEIIGEFPAGDQQRFQAVVKVEWEALGGGITENAKLNTILVDNALPLNPIGSPVASVPPASVACPYTPSPTVRVMDYPNFWLIANNSFYHEREWTLPGTPIAPGNYRITIATYDNHGAHGYGDTQPDERHFLDLILANGTVQTLPSYTNDVPDDGDLTETVFSNISVGPPAVQALRLRHSHPVPGSGNPNSLYALCTAFERL